ncbi:MAG: RING finger protein [Massiliimalia sp.]|jgi:hypothetical protein
MGKYEGINCPICGEPLENGKIVVICPECGAPYHKECVDRVGKCIFDELHAQHKAWEPPKKKEERQYAGDEEKRCSRCGSMNPIDGLFCEVCGNPLVHKENTGRQERPNMGPNQNPYGNYGQPNWQNNPYGQFSQRPHHIPYDPYTTPFGGVNADESIDQIPVRDWAIYIGQNTQYFIPKFKAMSEKGKGSVQGFNFAAMFFNGYYFLFRKMYLWGVMILALMLLLEIPSALYLIMTTPGLNTALGLNLDTELLAKMTSICYGLRLGVMVLCGVFGNHLYKIHCENKIQKLRSQMTEHHQYVTSLSRTGGTSFVVIFVLFLLNMVLSIVSVFLFSPF